MTKAPSPVWVETGAGSLALWHRPALRHVPRLKELGCQCVVTLLSEREGGREIGEAVRAAGIEWFWLPLPNSRPPTGKKQTEVVAALEVLSQMLDGRAQLLIHCSAGIHRTGMIAYALLRWRGHDEVVALEMIGRMRAQTREGVQSDRLAWADELVRAHRVGS